MLLASVLVLVSGAAAQGINCRGSGMCALNGGASLPQVKDQVGVLIASGQGDRRFNPGEQLACSRGSQGSICAFYQSGASGTARDAYAQLERLLYHGCRMCGSIPTQPGNDVSRGQLTVNFVTKPCCEGACHC